MSVSIELSRIQTNRNTIRAKLVELGMATSTDKLDTLATAIDNIINRGAVNAEVREGETFTIPAGYHNGSGVVSGVTGGGNYVLQTKSVTPTKKQQSIAPDTGYYGLSAVTVAAIPENFQDVSSVTAGAGDVLTGKVYVTTDGTVTAGTMTNNGAVNKTLDVTTITYTIPKGFHGGTGTVKITLEEKSVTPTKETQDITPTSGKVLSKVTVAAIPEKYVDTSDATATAEQILDGETAYVGTTKVEGTMVNNGTVTQTLDVTNGKQSYTIPQGYHSGKGAVSITLETKNATPTKSAQNITPTTGKVLSKVTVAAIPDAYQDVTSVDATAADVLTGKNIVASDGTKVAGSMANNGAINETIDGLTVTSYTIPAGYTSGGTVSLTSDIEEALAAI